MTKKEIQFKKDLYSGKFASYVAETVVGDKIDNSTIVLNIMKPLIAQTPDIECFWVFFLNAKNEIQALEKMFSGSLTSSAVYPREIIKKAIEHKAASVIFVHNHPSGCTEPSLEDNALTKRLVVALSFIDVTVLDHMIIGNSYYSYATSGFLKNCQQDTQKFLNKI